MQASDGNFYGTTTFGGVLNDGAIYRVTPGGVVSVLYRFQGQPGDGAFPVGGLVQGTDGNLYGATESGGAFGNGTLYKITPDGEHSILYSFSQDVGASPRATLVQHSNELFYSTTAG